MDGVSYNQPIADAEDVKMRNFLILRVMVFVMLGWAVGLWFLSTGAVLAAPTVVEQQKVALTSNDKEVGRVKIKFESTAPGYNGKARVTFSVFVDNVTNEKYRFFGKIKLGPNGESGEECTYDIIVGPVDQGTLKKTCIEKNTWDAFTISVRAVATP
jgi:hypothetical protein